MELLDAILRGEKSAAQEGLAAWGARRWEIAYENLRRILEGVTPPEFGALFQILADRAPHNADIDRAINNLERFHQAAEGFLLPTEIAADRPYLLAILIDLFGFSQFIADALVRYPHYAAWLGEPGALDAATSEAAIRASLQATLAPLEPRALRQVSAIRQRAAIRWSRRELVRAASRAALGLAEEDAIARELSWVASACIQAALEEAARALEARHGKPMEEGDDGKPSRREARLAVIGMGKLGGDELNFSSDIDLIFVYSAEGRTAGARDSALGSAAPLQGRITNHDYFCRVCSEIVTFLSEATDEGYLYRVDVRLRPDGADGPLARSLPAFEIYHETQARPWERMALIKGRAVAGDPALCAEFDRTSRALVFDRVMGGDVIKHVRELKRMIDADVERGPDAGREVKRGEGGIREIEFLVQAMQLLHGPRHPELRGRATLEAIAALAGMGALGEDEAGRMRKDYLFLRVIEHRLQMMDLRQTHAIPEDRAEIEALARRCGMQGDARRSAGDGLIEKWKEVRARVHARFAEFFGGAAEGAKIDARSPAQRAADAIAQSGSDNEIAPLLAAAGVDPSATLAALKRLGGTGSARYLDAGARDRYAAILPAMIEILVSCPRPGAALARLESMLGAAGSAAAYYEIFRSNPKILALLLRAFGAAGSWAQTLIAHPEYHDYLFNPAFIAEAPTRERMERRIAEWSAPPGDPARLSAALARLRRFEYAMTGLAETAGFIEHGQATARLSFAADVIINAAARGMGEAPGFAVVALGKLGARELNYFSDLDLLFCWDDRDGRGGLGDARATAVGESIMECLTRATPQGAVFDVDTRLRPEGKNAPLAPPVSRYVDYYRERADLWEFQSMMKARAVAGDLAAGEALIAAVAGEIRGRLEKMDWRRDVAEPMRQMRLRIEAAAKVPRWALCDFKKGRGGVIDLEFIAQYFQLKRLAEGESWIGLRADEVFARAAAAGDLDEPTANSMREDYRFLRRLETRSRLLFETELSLAPAGGEKLEDLARALADVDEPASPDALRDRLQEAMRRNRHAFDQVLGGGDS